MRAVAVATFMVILGAGVLEGAELEHPLFRAVKVRNDDQVAHLLRQGTPPNVRTADGTTPLMIAALHGSGESLRLLLERGANPNAVNDDGCTALLWAVSDPEKVRLLLSSDAKANVRSKAGMTPLLAAASLPTGAPVVELLLSHDAEIETRNNQGHSALRYAMLGGSLETLKLLFDHASRSGKLDALIGDDATILLQLAHDPEGTECATLLCEQLTRWNEGRLPDAGQAVAMAMLNQRPDVALILLEHGAEVEELVRPAKSPVALLTAYSDREDPSMLRALLERGVDVTTPNEHGETALTWARRRGHSDLAKELEAAGVPEGTDVMPEVPPRDVNLHAGNQRELLSESVSRSVALLLRGSDGFLEARSCTSCHQNDLPAIAASWARDRGLSIDAGALDRLINRQTSPSAVDGWVSRAYDMRRGIGFNPRAIGQRLWEYSAIGYPPDDHIEAMVWSVASMQESDGRWRELLSRPPITGGNFSATAYAILALKLYPIAGREEEFEERIDRAEEWLRQHSPDSHQDRIYQLLGAGWAGGCPDELSEMTNDLLQLQREDGGWAQFPNLPSDAWATGQSLVALHVAGGVPTNHAAYQRGLRYLLNTQFEDGSWWVKSRSFPFQEPFESGFPHGRDQWISAPATAWAAMAMTLAIEPGEATLPASIGGGAASLELAAAGEGGVSTAQRTSTAAAGTLPVDFTRDVQPVLERSCVGCHSGDKPKGNLDMSHRDALLRGGDSGTVSLIPGLGDESLVLIAASGEDPDLVMPPENKRENFPALSAEDLDVLKRWIDSGAPWPKDVKLKKGGY